MPLLTNVVASVVAILRYMPVTATVIHCVIETTSELQASAQTESRVSKNLLIT